jgi:hypothetical protein
VKVQRSIRPIRNAGCTNFGRAGILFVSANNTQTIFGNFFGLFGKTKIIPVMPTVF